MFVQMSMFRQNFTPISLSKLIIEIDNFFSSITPENCNLIYWSTTTMLCLSNTKTWHIVWSSHRKSEKYLPVIRKTFSDWKLKETERDSAAWNEREMGSGMGANDPPPSNDNHKLLQRLLNDDTRNDDTRVTKSNNEQMNSTDDKQLIRMARRTNDMATHQDSRLSGHGWDATPA